MLWRDATGMREARRQAGRMLHALGEAVRPGQTGRRCGPRKVGKHMIGGLHPLRRARGLRRRCGCRRRSARPRVRSARPSLRVLPRVPCGHGHRQSESDKSGGASETSERTTELRQAAAGVLRSRATDCEQRRRRVCSSGGASARKSDEARRSAAGARAVCADAADVQEDARTRGTRCREYRELRTAKLPRPRQAADDSAAELRTCWRSASDAASMAGPS